MVPGRLAVANARVQPAAMEHTSELALLSSIRAQLDDLDQRLRTLADAFATTTDSQVATELFNAERALRSTARAVDRASDALQRD